MLGWVWKTYSTESLRSTSIYRDKPLSRNLLTHISTSFCPLMKDDLYSNCCCCFSHWVISDTFASPGTVVCKSPLSMGLPRQEYWSELPFPSPRDLPNPGIEPMSPTLAGEFFTTELSGKCLQSYTQLNPYEFKVSWTFLYFILACFQQ